jgi:hypothetical protein
MTIKVTDGHKTQKRKEKIYMIFISNSAVVAT